MLATGAPVCWGTSLNRNSFGLLGLAGALGLGNTPASCNVCDARTCCLGDDEAIAGVAPVRAFSPSM